MAFEIPGFMRSWTAGGTAGTAGSDLSIPNTAGGISIQSYQYMFVRFNSGLIVSISATTQEAIGVLQNKPAPGQAAQVMTSGVTKVRSSDATITIGTPVYVDQYGFANSAAINGTGTPVGNKCVGIAEEVSATATGYMIAVLLKPLGAIQ
jgi:hypothetical protein